MDFGTIIGFGLFGIILWLAGNDWIKSYFESKEEFIQNMIDNSEDDENA